MSHPHLVHRGLPFFYAQVSLASGEHNKAIEEYNNALAIDPRYALAYYNRGITYWNLNHREKAISDFVIAARLGNNGAQDFLKSQDITW